MQICFYSSPIFRDKKKKKQKMKKKIISLPVLLLLAAVEQNFDSIVPVYSFAALLQSYAKIAQKMCPPEIKY